MKAEIICVGSEILFGDILNTNTKYLSSRLTDLGILVYYQTVVGDYKQDLLDVLEMAYKRSQVIILTGGLGPTSDDITKETVAESLGLTLEVDLVSKERLEAFFFKRGYTMADNNYKQALIPVTGQALDNNNGTAPGVYIENKENHLFILPGPPGEMIPMFEEQMVPMLLQLTDLMVYGKTLKLTGIGESDAAQQIQHIIDGHHDPIIAPYAKLAEVHFRITSQGSDLTVCKKRVLAAEEEIRAVLGDYIFTDDYRELNEVVVDMMKAQGLEIALAESCTGGWLSKSLVDVPGSSEIYREGIITYSNDSKIKYLGIDPEILGQFGAVSEAVAIEMAQGIRRVAYSDIGVGITGIAGPSGGTEEKPVGTVHIAIDFKGEIYHYPEKLSGNRDKIRENTVKRTLMYLYYILAGKPL